MVGNKDFTIYQGATFIKNIKWEIEDVPVNLNGYGVRMQVRPDYADRTNEVFLTASTGDGRIVIRDQDTNPGEIIITIPSSVTETLSWSMTKPARYDLEFENGGVVTRLLQGFMFMNKEVTRPE